MIFDIVESMWIEISFAERKKKKETENNKGEKRAEEIGERKRETPLI